MCLISVSQGWGSVHIPFIPNIPFIRLKKAPTAAPSSGLGVAAGRGFGYIPALTAPVAQLDRAPDYGSGGWKFESFRARQ